MPELSADVLRLVQEQSPTFARSIEKAARQARLTSTIPAVSVTLRAFEDNPLLLYAALLYARSCGVEARFRPSPYADEQTPPA